MTTLGTFEFLNLFAGSEKDRVHEPGTMETGEVLVVGSLVAKVTATGKWKEAEFSEIADYSRLGLTSTAVDSSAGEVPFSAWVEGEFNENGVTFFYGDAPDDWRDTLANKGIYLRRAISPAGF